MNSHRVRASMGAPIPRTSVRIRPPEPLRGRALRAVPQSRGGPSPAPFDARAAGRDPGAERLRFLHDVVAGVLGFGLPFGASEGREPSQTEEDRLGTRRDACGLRWLRVQFELGDELVELRPVVALATGPPEDADPREAHRAAAGRLVPPPVP